MKKGLSLIEIVVVLFLIVVVVPAIYGVLTISVRSLNIAEREVEASYLASEGLEVVRNLRDAGWDANINGLSGDYCASLSGGAWSLTVAGDCTVSGTLFTRTINIASVDRDSNDDIVPSGTLDSNTKLITSTVSWQSHDATRSVVLETYITNFLFN